MPGLQLEVRKTYLNKLGEEKTIEREVYDDLYPFKDTSGVSYTDDGHMFNFCDDESDLICEKLNSTNPKDLIGVKKPSLASIPASALVHQAMAHRYGHEKYGFYNWRDSPVQAMIYIDAALRHLLCYLDGESHDKDSNVHHLAHVVANCNILLDAAETGNLIDNRPPKGMATDVLERFTKC